MFTYMVLGIAQIIAAGIILKFGRLRGVERDSVPYLRREALRIGLFTFLLLNGGFTLYLTGRGVTEDIPRMALLALLLATVLPGLTYFGQVRQSKRREQGFLPPKRKTEREKLKDLMSVLPLCVVAVLATHDTILWLGGEMSTEKYLVYIGVLSLVYILLRIRLRRKWAAQSAEDSSDADAV
ncbi:MAG: hypothetical protein CXX72_03215 [Methanobacteriota archaeon]|nr:MAG: hypothetical protein CXX72_03215 [Euryarchaeota archaeon]